MYLDCGGHHQNMDVFDEAFVETGSLVEDCLLVERGLLYLNMKEAMLDNGRVWWRFQRGESDLNFAPKTNTNASVCRNSYIHNYRCG